MGDYMMGYKMVATEESKGKRLQQLLGLQLTGYNHYSQQSYSKASCGSKFAVVAPSLSSSTQLQQGTDLITIMIGIQEDVLNMFLISHFLILFSVSGLVFAFTLLLCFRMNSNLRSSLPRSGGWFGGSQVRRAPQPIFVEQPRQRSWWQRS